MAKKEQNDPKILAFVTTFLSIVGFIIALLAWRDDKYVMYYAKQSLVVFIVAVIASILQALAIIPIIGWLIMIALNIIVILLWALSWIYALSGEMKPVPVVGQFGNSFKF